MIDDDDDDDDDEWRYYSEATWNRRVEARCAPNCVASPLDVPTFTPPVNLPSIQPHSTGSRGIRTALQSQQFMPLGASSNQYQTATWRQRSISAALSIDCAEASCFVPVAEKVPAIHRFSHHFFRSEMNFPDRFFFKLENSIFISLLLLLFCSCYIL